MLDIKVKNTFFDRAKVIDRVGKARAKSLSHDGAFVRTRMKSLTGRRSKNSAPPGQPPKRHAGQLHDLIYFGLNSNDTTVDIGPTPFRKGLAPKLLEFGGDATINDRRTGLPMRAHYRGNPFAGPSLKAAIESGEILNAWKGSVRN